MDKKKDEFVIITTQFAALERTEHDASVPTGIAPFLPQR
jgi:hypothetical protein